MLLSSSERVGLLTDIHVSPLSRENTGGQARSGERALSDAEPLSSHFASRRWFLPSQNQTSIRCLGPKGRHRRLSVCSLPVLKQSEGSLGRFVSFAQSVSGRTWQSASLCDPGICVSPARFLGSGVAAMLHG